MQTVSDGSCMLIMMTDKPRGGLLFLFFPFPVVMTGYCSDWRYKQEDGSEGQNVVSLWHKKSV